jgi:hypothetical protein
VISEYSVDRALSPNLTLRGIIAQRALGTATTDPET